MKQPVKKNVIEKKKFDLSSYKKEKNFSGNEAEKPESWIPVSDAFTDALKIPGIPRGNVSLFRGFSNTGKSTAFYETIAGAQKIGDLPVIIEVEGNWKWDHAKDVGVEFEEIIDEDTGEITYEGHFLLFRADDLLRRYELFDYSDSKWKSKPLRAEAVIEDVSKLIRDLLLEQKNGDLPFNLCFCYDSIGVLDCFKSSQSGSSNNMWNAGAMEASFKTICNQLIPNSRLASSEYTNTFVAVQKVWLDSSGMGQPVMKHKGGESMWYSSRLIVHFGGVLSSGVKILNATYQGNGFNYGVETKIKCVKNQVTGIEMEGKICSTAHGYVRPDKLDEYKKEHKDYFKEKLSVDFENITFGSELSDLTE